jgi:glycine cleavage system H protein
MTIPNDRRYTRTHEWAKVEGKIVTMGITQYAADELTDITYAELPEVGATVVAGQTCGEIESVKATSELLSAVSGRVVEVNEALREHPEYVNQDAYGKGWMIRVEAADIRPLAELLDAAAYELHTAAG